MGLAPVRNLRIVLWKDHRPYHGLCTRCERLFVLRDSNSFTVQDARDDLEDQFRNHFCEEVRRSA